MTAHGAIEHRPSAYLSCASLARELDVSESTVSEMVRRGVLPRPYRLSGGCVRWRWAEVEAALASLSQGSSAGATSDPFMEGIANAATT